MKYLWNMLFIQVIYSGILDSEYDNIKKQLCNGYIEEERITINEWTGVRLKKC